MKLHNYLKSSRMKINKTQTEMANLINISRVLYNRLETNKFYLPSFKTVKKIADYFNLSEEEIRRML